MAEYKKQMVLFKDISGKKVEIDFNGGEITSDAGLLFLGKIESRIGIIKRVTHALIDKRHPSYVKHHLLDLFTQRVFQIAAGYEDANDSDSLRNDPAFKIACDKCPESDPPLASQPTMSRFENAPSRTDLYRIANAMLEGFIDSYHVPPPALILDIDETADPTYGHQQMTLFNAHYGSYCYQPIHLYEGQSGKLITAVLRPGKNPSAKEIVMILKRVVQRLQAAWPETEIILRGDSQYGAADIYDFCESSNIFYIVGLKPYPPLLKKAQSLLNKARALYEAKGVPIKLYGEFQYRADKWKQARRIIFKVEYSAKGSNIRFIITSLKHANRRFIYEKVYCGRGAMELMIKDHKNHLASDRTSCSSFAANQFRLFLHSMAYMLMHAFRSLDLKTTEFARAQFDTIRLKLLKIGARVREMKTKIKIHLPSSFPQRDEFMTIWNSCCAGAKT